MEKTLSISSHVKPRIMRRVYGVWTLRLLAPIVFFELPALAILLNLSFKYIFFHQVFENIAVSVNGFGSFVNYVYFAFIHAPLHTEIVLVLGVAVAFLLAKDFSRSLRNLGAFMSRRLSISQF